MPRSYIMPIENSFENSYLFNYYSYSNKPQFFLSKNLATYPWEIRFYPSSKYNMEKVGDIWLEDDGKIIRHPTYRCCKLFIARPKKYLYIYMDSNIDLPYMLSVCYTLQSIIKKEAYIG